MIHEKKENLPNKKGLGGGGGGVKSTKKCDIVFVKKITREKSCKHGHDRISRQLSNFKGKKNKLQPGI